MILDEEPEAAGPVPRIADSRDVPILVNSFNRLACLTRLIEWLRAAGQRRIIVLDNASSFPPLLAYLDAIERAGQAKIVRLGDNHGHLGLWERGLLGDLGIDTEYVYTDPDVVPCGACPADLVARLQRLLRDEPAVHKAGPALRLDDLPDHYACKAEVLTWEGQFWTRPATPSLFRATIDTTFALYRPGGDRGLDRLTLRTGWPYVARHLGWYADSGTPTAEDAHYAETARPGLSWWSAPSRPPEIAAAVASLPPAPVLLHLGSRRDVSPHGYAHEIPNGGALDGILVGAVGHDLPWTALTEAARPGALLVLRCPLDRLGAFLPGSRPDRHRPRVGAGWAVRRLTVVETEPAEAILHLSRYDGFRVTAPAMRVQTSRLDFAAAFATAAD